MKKNHLFALLAVATGLFAFIPQQKKDLGIPPTHEAQVAEADTLRQLFAAGQYDAVISHCAAARAANTLGYSDQEQALATAWWHKGDKSRAYQYVLNNADYELALSGGAGSPFSMLYDLSFDTVLATDAFLEQMITDRVTAYYSKNMHYYPENGIGLKLMILNFKCFGLDAKYRYDLKHRPADELEHLDKAYQEESNRLADRLIALMHDNGDKLYTSRDIGPAADKQIEMLRAFTRKEDQAFAAQLLRKALENKEISPDTYVDGLLAVERLKHPDEDRIDKLEDSLCRIYKCKRMRVIDRYHFVSYSGDSVRLITRDSGDFTYIEATGGNGEIISVKTTDAAMHKIMLAIDTMALRKAAGSVPEPSLKADSLGFRREPGK